MKHKNIIQRFFALSFLLLSVTACQTIEKKDYAAYREADPHSILIVPVVNNSIEVDAPDLFLTTVSRYLSERGYYVFPVNLVKKVMEEDGMGDANLVHESDPTRLGEIFGSDMALYVKIQNWNAQWAVLATTVTVELEYKLVDTRSGQTLWEETQKRAWTPQNRDMGHPLATLFAAVVQAAMTKAAPNYIPLAQTSNQIAFNQVNRGLPAGPYHKDYQNDMKDF